VKWSGGCESISERRTATRTPFTLRDALISLGTLCLLQYKINEKTTVTKLPQPSANQTKILTALGVILPAKM
jgi:hypothetical protein